MDEFAGRKLIIASKHKKEEVIAPVLERELGVRCEVVVGFDTDQLGTFSGEVERTDDPLSTARKKCQLAIERSGCDLAVASEGSFGAHPGIPFSKGNDEIVMLIDNKNSLEITGREVSVNTNFDGKYIEDAEALRIFSEHGRFPSHALILKNHEHKFDEVVKGITDWEHLVGSFEQLKKEYGKVFVETDMRALYNPTRMKVIAKATENLVERVKSRCVKCNAPGFVVTDVIKGLPCSWCNKPTQSVRALIYTCSCCGFKQKESILNKKKEDPMYCDYCNP